MSKFTIVADYGKPYSMKIDSESMLKKELLGLKKLSENDYPYFDVWVYDEHDKDITDEIFKKLKING